MTVQELIEILQKVPKDAEVVVCDTNGDDTTHLSIWNYYKRNKKVEILGEPDAKEYARKHRTFITMDIDDGMA